MKKIFAVIVLALVLISTAHMGQAAYAVDTNTCYSSGNCYLVEINSIYTRPSDGLVLIGTTADETALACVPWDLTTYTDVSGTASPTTTKNLSFTATATGGDHIYSLLLTHYQTGDPVNIRVVSGGGSCEISYVWSSK